jgi:hypothetical protein
MFVRFSWRAYRVSRAVEALCSYVGSEVLTTAVIKSSVFWDITLCSPLKVN